MPKKILISASLSLGAVTLAFPSSASSCFEDSWHTPYPNTTMSWSDAWNANDAKSGYCLFNPVPDDKLRYYYVPLGGTPAVTIDAGHLALDVSPFSYSYNSMERYSGLSRTEMTTRSYGFGDTWVDVGVLNNLQVSAGFGGYNMIKRTDKDAFAEDHPAPSYGFKNFGLRAQYNLFGNDGGNMALSVLGHVNFPTASGSFDRRDDYSGGPGLAFDYFTPCGFDLRLGGSMNVTDHSGCWDACFCDSISATHKICCNLYGFAGFESQVSTRLNSESRPESSNSSSSSSSFYEYENHQYHLSASTGLYYRFTDSLDVYAKADFGIHNADDAGVSCGVNWRLNRLW